MNPSLLRAVPLFSALLGAVDTLYACRKTAYNGALCVLESRRAPLTMSPNGLWRVNVVWQKRP